MIVTDAVQIAIEMMLQEDFSHPTTRLLALHACSTYLEQKENNLLAAFTEDDKPTLDEDEDEYVVGGCLGLCIDLRRCVYIGVDCVWTQYHLLVGWQNPSPFTFDVTR